MLDFVYECMRYIAGLWTSVRGRYAILQRYCTQLCHRHVRQVQIKGENRAGDRQRAARTASGLLFPLRQLVYLLERAFDRYQIRSSKGIRRYWLLMSLVHLIACTGCGEAMSFEDGYAYIYSHIHIQEERLRFIYQCGARHVLFEEVLALVA